MAPDREACELIIVGKPIITYRNREIVATRPQPATPPSTPTTPIIGPPTVAGFVTPNGIAPGSKVTITGTNFVAGSQVTFGGVPSSKVTFITATQIDAEVPANAITGPIMVTTPSGSNTSPASFIAQPRIKSISPKNAVPGTAITIEGENLDNATSVNFGSVAQTVFLFKDKNKIIANVPEKAESAIRVVTPVGDATPPSTEKFIAQPVLDALATKSGKTDDRIIITGKNLDNAEVFFGNARAEVVNPGSTSIEIKVPENAVSGPITVRTAPGVEKKSEDFTFIPKPEILLISVDGGAAAETASGKTGSMVTITGQNLKDVKEVKFGDVVVTPTEKTDSRIIFTVPEGAGSGKITIETPGGVVSTDKFTFIPAPTITTFSVNGGTAEAQASGKADDTVVITGKNLKDAVVKVGGLAVTPTNPSDTQLTVKVPAGLTPGKITIEITTPGGKVSTDKFTFTQ